MIDSHCHLDHEPLSNEINTLLTKLYDAELILLLATLPQLFLLLVQLVLASPQRRRRRAVVSIVATPFRSRLWGQANRAVLLLHRTVTHLLAWTLDNGDGPSTAGTRPPVHTCHEAPQRPQIAGMSPA